MAEDSRAKLTLDGDVAPLKQKLREAGAAMKGFGTDAERAIGGINSPLKVLSGSLGALGLAAAAGGFALFVKNAINAADALDKLSIRTGISVDALSGLKYAADLSDVGVNDLATGVGRLAKFIGEAEGGNKKFQEILKLLGVTAKDPEKALVQLAAANERFADETDRAAILSQVLSRGYQTLLPLFEGGAAGLQKNIDRGRELNGITKESSSKAAEFNDALTEAQTAAQSVGTAIAVDLLPYLSRALKAWRDSAQKIGAVNSALVGLGQLGPVGQTIGVLWANVAYVFKQVGNEIGGIAAQLAALLRGDFKQAGFIGDAMKEDAKIARKELDDLEKRIFTVVGTASSGLQSATAGPAQAKIKVPKNLFGSEGDGSKEKEAKIPDSFLQTYETALANEKRLAYERDALRGYSKTEELAYWQFLISNADLRSKDRTAIERKVSDLIIDIKRTEAQQKTAIDAEQIRGAEALALGRVEAEQTAAQTSFDLGQINKGQLLALEQDFERQRYEIQRAALEERLILLQQDPNTNPAERDRLNNLLLEMEQQHQIRRLQLLGQAQQEELSIWDRATDRISSLFDKGQQALLNGTLTWRNAMRAIYAEVGAFFIQEAVAKPFKEWLATQVRMIAAKLGFATQETAIETAKSATTTATKATEATAVVGSNAASAASGAASSVASIPYVGPILAAAAFASILALVLGARSSIKSAAKGYDIPVGLNPIAQLHQEEMVLPAQYANVIRDIAGQASASSAPAESAPVHIYARNDDDVVRVGDMKKLLRQMRRDFVDVGGRR